MQQTVLSSVYMLVFVVYLLRDLSNHSGYDAMPILSLGTVDQHQAHTLDVAILTPSGAALPPLLDQTHPFSILSLFCYSYLLVYRGTRTKRFL